MQADLYTPEQYAVIAANSRQLRMPDPSLPDWAQLPETLNYVPAVDTPLWFRWRQHVLFQNMLEYRHYVESAINSDHIIDDPASSDPAVHLTQHGQRQSGLVPWIFQQLPDQTVPPMTTDAIELYWLMNWGDRTRTLMAMLRAKDNHESLGEPRRQWAIFMNGTSNFGWDVLWKRTERQRDQVYLAEVTDYTSVTGTWFLRQAHKCPAMAGCAFSTRRQDGAVSGTPLR